MIKALKRIKVKRGLSGKLIVEAIVKTRYSTQIWKLIPKRYGFDIYSEHYAPNMQEKYFTFHYTNLMLDEEQKELIRQMIKVYKKAKGAR